MWRAGAGALRGPLVVSLCLLCFVTGSLMATPSSPAPPMVTQPTAAVTDESVRALARALERATTAPTPVTTPEVDQAEEVLEAVQSGQIHVVPAPTATVATTTTTTAPPTTTTTTTAPDDTYRWPTPTVTIPPPYTVTIP